MSWSAVFGVWFRELWNGVATSEGNFYIGVLKKISDFSDI
jgi:hypothetical protein